MMSLDAPSPLSTLTPNSSSPPTPSPAPTPTSTKHLFKIILRAALQKANVAVLCDSANDVVGAIDAYSEAIALLNRVLANVDKESDRQRLQDIHDSYSERIRLLTATSPKCDSDDLYETFTDPNLAHSIEDEPSPSGGKSWLVKSTKRRISNRVQQSTQQAYSAIIRRMASSSSIDSIQSLDQRPTPSTVTSASGLSALKLSPAPHSSSRSTPNHLKNTLRRPTLPKLHSVHDSTVTKPSSRMTLNAQGNAGNRRLSVTSIALSIDSQSSTDTEVDSPVRATALQPSMALPSIHKFDSPVVSIDDEEDDGEEEDDALQSMSPSQPTSPSTSIVRMRTSSLPRLLDIDPPGPETYGPRPSVSTSRTAAPTMRRAHTQPQQPITIDTRPTMMRQLTGLSSVRKKANRLSRSSMDGSGRKERGSLAPVFGLFVKDMMGPPRPNDEPSTTLTPTAPEPAHARPGSKEPLKLLLMLERSLLYGGYISYRLYIPKSLWYQTSIRLTSLDVKAAACEGLATDLARLERWTKLNDVATSLQLMEVLEESVEKLRASLSKKLKQDNLPDQPGAPNREGHMETKKNQTLMSWGTKISKSVERMNAFSLTKADDQYRHYLEALQTLFAKVHILEDWLQHYAIVKRENPRYEACIHKLTRICELINTVVGGFVIRDATILLDKWLKRGGAWVND